MSDEPKLFDFLNAIHHTNKKFKNMKDYKPFIINRFLSYSYDCAIVANEMNLYSEIPKDIQFEFLKAMVPKRKRFERWQKQKKVTDLDIIKNYYGYSDDKAKEVMEFITKDEIKRLKLRMNKGGKK